MPALLAGLLHCRRCGHKLLVNYTGCRHDVARYQCRRGWLDKGEPTCIGFSGQAADQAVAKEILRVVQPAAIEAARLASVEQSRRVDEVVATLQRDLEAARYGARRAQKQYDLADPDTPAFSIAMACSPGAAIGGRRSASRHRAATTASLATAPINVTASPG